MAVTDSSEEWRPVVGWEGFYEVSDQGRVKSLPRTVLRSGPKGVYTVRGQILKLTVSDGYVRVALHGYGHREAEKRRVHHLVLEAFEGPCPLGEEGCHGNDDGTDNRRSNLRWDTRSANQKDCVLNGNNRNANKTHCVHGHEFTPENIRIDEGGWRQCRTCERQRDRAAKAARRERAQTHGTCPNCGHLRENASLKLCDRCREKARERTRLYRAKARM